MKIMFVGDVSLGEYYLSLGHGPRTLADEIDLFDQVRPVLETADLVAGNLEAPLCTHDYDLSEPERIVLKAKPEHARQLKNAGFAILQVANNHTLQHGCEGFDETLDTLSLLGMHAVGLDRQAPLEITHEGLRIGFLAASDIPDNTYREQARYQRMDSAFLERVESAAREFDHLVVMLHWGLEASTRPVAYQREIADRFHAAGVSAVIGSHPHLFYEIESRPGFVCAYSLGNFVFDLCWDSRMTRSGILEIEFTRDGLKSRFWPVSLSQNGCIPVPAGESLKVCDKLVPYNLGKRMDFQQLRKTGYLLGNLHRGLTRIKLKFFGRKILGLFRAF